MKRVYRHGLITIAVLAVGYFAASTIIKTTPKPQRVAPVAVVPLVEVAPLIRDIQRPTWQAGAQVMAQQQVHLAAQVSARVVAINDQAIPGARLSKGTVLAQLEQADFELLVQQRQAMLRQVQADLALERGAAQQAREEFELMADSVIDDNSRALVLREPQLARAEAAVANAEALLKQAQLELARTTVRMPFSGQILRRDVSIGTQVGLNTALFELVQTEQFWLETKIPRAFLPWLDSDEPARVLLGAGSAEREARVLQVIPGVDSQDRQIKVLLALDDPLALDHPQWMPVMVNDFVTVQLSGRAISNSVRLPIAYLQDDNSVWLVHNERLQRVKPNIIYRGREYAWITDQYTEQHSLLLSRLNAPVDGMPVRVLTRSENKPDAMVGMDGQYE